MGNTVGSRQFRSDDYIAGFFDGDGSVVATLERYNSTRFPYRVRLKLNFTQHARFANELATIQKTLGGVGVIRTNTSKRLAELVIQNRNEVRAVLERLRSKLYLKKPQALLALRVLAVMRGNEKHKPSVLSDSAYTHVLSLVQSIRRLNAHTGGKRQRIQTV